MPETPEIVVVGAGFAGLWAAAAAARVRDETGGRFGITVVDPGDVHVLRPLLYQDEHGQAGVPLDRLLGPVDITHRRAAVTAVDPHGRSVTTTGPDGVEAAVGYDQLVVATGSALVRPDVPGDGTVLDVDTLPSATALTRHLRALPETPADPARYTAVVVGAGFVGLETATELVDRLRDVAGPHGRAEEVRVVLVEREPEVGPELGPGPRPAIEAALDELKIECRLGVTVERVDPDTVVLSDGTVLDARTVVWCGGMRANRLAGALPGDHDGLGRLAVDEFLRLPGHPEIAVAGDVAAAAADGGHCVMQSCQHALPQGLVAGQNAASALLGEAPTPFEAAEYVTCLDLGAAGGLFTTGWERTVQVTGAEGKTLKQQINASIRPPADEPGKFLHIADAGRHKRAFDD